MASAENYLLLQRPAIRSQLPFRFADNFRKPDLTDFQLISFRKCILLGFRLSFFGRFSISTILVCFLLTSFRRFFGQVGLIQNFGIVGYSNFCSYRAWRNLSYSNITDNRNWVGFSLEFATESLEFF